MQLAYDPVSLEMRSCLGWPEHALREERARLDDLLAREGGFGGYTWWHYKPRGADPTRRNNGSESQALPDAQRALLADALTIANTPRWTLSRVSRRGAELCLELVRDGDAIVLSARPVGEGPSYRAIGRVAFSYSIRAGCTDSPREREETLDAWIGALAVPVEALLSTPPTGLPTTG
jgi:hypothetical protein